MTHHHVTTEFVRDLERSTSAGRCQLLLGKLAEVCSKCAQVIAEAREERAVEAPLLPRGGLDVLAREGERRALVEELRRLSPGQRLLKINNQPRLAGHPGVIETVFILARQALPDEPRTSLEWGEAAQALAERSGDDSARLLALAYQGNAYRALSDRSTARPLIQAALEGLSLAGAEHPDRAADVLSFAASLFTDDGRYSDALTCLERAASYYAQLAEHEGLIRVQMMLGVVHGEMENIPAALMAERAALGLMTTEHRLYWPAKLNYAMHLQMAGRCTEARDMLDWDLEEYLSHSEILARQASWLQARLAVDAGELGAAESLFVTLMETFEREEHAYNFAMVSIELALLYHAQGVPEKVLATTRRAVALFQADGLTQHAAAGVLLLLDQLAQVQAVTVEHLRRALHQLRTGAEVFTSETG